MGIFDNKGITTTHVVIEKDGKKLALVEAKPRGAPGAVVGGSKRTGVSFMCAHLPTTATILADEVQGVRAFGEESAAQQIQAVIDDRQAEMAQRLDLTHEFHRVGALKGKVINSNGAELYDLFQAFDMKQQVVPMDLGTPAADLQGKCLDILERIEEGLGEMFFSGATVQCGKNFWRKFTTHKAVKAAFERWNEGAFGRGDLREPFYFGGLFWERYRGTVGGKAFIEAEEAYAHPVGSPGLFMSRFAPGDYMDTVNTVGLPVFFIAMRLASSR